MNQLAELDLDPKRARVLEGAMRVFLTYGFARVTMEDIARAAELSRPALYLLFKNKTEIFRALGLLLLDRSASHTEKALSGPGTLTERLLAAIESGLIAMMKDILESPHGIEIIDHKNSLAVDIVATWRMRLHRAVAGAIADEAARTGVDLAARGFSAGILADLLLDGLEAMKARVRTVEEQRNSATQLVAAIVQTLQP